MKPADIEWASIGKPTVEAMTRDRPNMTALDLFLWMHILTYEERVVYLKTGKMPKHGRSAEIIADLKVLAPSI